MSDKPISVGDLVMVVRPTSCCGNSKNIGAVFIVDDILINVGECAYCSIKEAVACAFEPNWKYGMGAYSLNRLKRIDPDCLRDDVREAEKLPTKEPA